MGQLIGMDSFRADKGVYETSRIYVFSNTPNYDWKQETDLVVLLMINALQYSVVTGYHEIDCNRYYSSVRKYNEFVFAIARVDRGQYRLDEHDRYVPDTDH